MQRSYIMKESVYQNIVKFALKHCIDVADRRLFHFVMEFFKSKIDNQLKGTCEIIALRAQEHLERNVGSWLLNHRNENPSGPEITAWDALEPKEIWKKFLNFWKFENQEIDREIKKCLEEYVKTSEISYETFSEIHKAYRLLEFIVSHHYIFNTFDAAETKKCDKADKFETFIRLFHDGNEKFLFVREVQTEVKRVLNRKLHGILDAECNEQQAKTDEDRKDGRFLTMPYSMFVETFEKMQCATDSITLVNIEVKRTRHLTVPILSPYGDPCKPLADVFYEVLSILTIEMQVWQRIQPRHVEELVEVILKELNLLVGCKKSQHVITTDFVTFLGDRLRGRVEKFLKKSGTETEAKAQLPPVKAFANGQKPLTWYLLYKEVVEIWRLPELFPVSQVSRAVDIVFAKNIGIQGKGKGPTMITRLELTMMVQQCIAFCFTRDHQVFRHLLGFCKLDPNGKCGGCVDPVTRKGKSGSVTCVRGKSDFQLKFTHFKTDDMTHASLFDEKNRERVVTSEMARSFVLQALLGDVSVTPLSDYIIKNYSEDVKSKWRQVGENSDDFYMTMEEMVKFSVDVKKKYISEQKAARKRANFSSGPVRPEIAKFYAPELISGVETWMRYTNRCLESVKSFAEVSTDRKFYVKVREHVEEEKDEKEYHVNSGEVLESVEIVMEQKEAETISRKDWGLLAQLKKRWASDIGWVFVPVEEALEAMKLLPVDLERFYFVPEINRFFWNLVMEGLRPEDRELKVKVSKETPKETKETSTTSKGTLFECDGRSTESKIKEFAEALADIFMEEDEDEGDDEDEDEEEEEEEESSSEEQEFISKEALTAAFTEFTKQFKLQQDAKQAQENIEALKAKRTVMVAEEEKRKLKVKLTAKTQEVERLKGKLAARPKDFQNDPNVVKLMKSKDQRIRELEQKSRDVDSQLKALKDDQKALNQSIQSTRHDLNRSAEEKTLLKRQIAEGKVKNSELQKLLDAAKNVADARMVAVLQRNERLILENRKLTNQLSALRASMSGSSTSSGPSSSSSSTTPPPTPTPTYTAPSSSECNICFNDMDGTAQTTKCNVCKTQWHTRCISEWTTTNATCPICRRSFPNPEMFPPLGSRRH